ncbi:hypothetical protein U1Q18_012226 [Sarracenia purpurea var. burkii]
MSMALGHHACVRMMEYQQSYKVMEHKIQCLKDKEISIKNEAHILKIHTDKASAELYKSVEACSLPKEENRKLAG